MEEQIVGLRKEVHYCATYAVVRHGHGAIKNMAAMKKCHIGMLTRQNDWV